MWYHMSAAVSRHSYQEETSANTAAQQKKPGSRWILPISSFLDKEYCIPVFSFTFLYWTTLNVTFCKPNVAQNN